ncbi:MAG: nuclear transport factor 2 family protein [Acidobacteriota bacterium]
MTGSILGRTVLALAALASGAVGRQLAAETATPAAAAAPCAAPEYRQLDFWAGDWDAYEVGKGDQPIARARIDMILDGCALRETYEQADGLVGQSLTTYDASRKLWHQTWVTNRAQLLAIEGTFQGERLTLQGPRPAADGRPEILRGVWSHQGDGVRETAHVSADGGATWRPLFDVLFQRRKGENRMTTSTDEDGKAVAALDTEYQAAVKRNDAATMDRILADDFVLVTGRGRASTKADLLAEARSQSTVYEHQEELEQKVRVWGDTAVVTALLWIQGTEAGKTRDYKLWFSDTYVRTPAGWKYVFGQASLPLPKEP